ncbi:MAG TPA: LCP family protein [Nitriliruptorales bacterium]|nr:LCP family protein [Nitriliruptorales bacterium]
MTTTPLEEREEDWGATVHGGRRRRRWGLRRVALGLVVVALVLMGLGAGAAVYASTRMERVPVEGLQPAGVGEPLHLLVVGSDSREGLTPEQQEELTTGDMGGDRTDTIMVMTIRGGRAAMLSFPRDLYVERCDGSVGRINGATGIAGPGCLVQTVVALSGIPISNYLEVHFLGFRDIVQAVGGVDVCLERAIADPFAGIDLPAGCQRLDGTQALGYVRVRKIDSDLERIERQQGFLSALASEIVSPSTLVNPLRLYRTAGEVGSTLTTDRGMGAVDLSRVGLGMLGLARGRSVTATVPATGDSVGGAAVLRVQEGEAAALFARFRDGSILQQARPAGALAPGDVHVAVRNGAEATGLAGRTAEALEEAGFQVDDVGNADPVDATQVRYPPGSEEAARLVADQLPAEPQLQEDPNVQMVTIVLGPDAATG